MIFLLMSDQDANVTDPSRTCITGFTVCPRSGIPFYIVTNYLKLVTTSWTYSSKQIINNILVILKVGNKCQNFAMLEWCMIIYVYLYANVLEWFQLLNRNRNTITLFQLYSYHQINPGIRVRIRSDPLIFGPLDPDPLLFS